MKLSLIDHFNAFHLRSQELGLSANARSLYFAILGEFNKMQYPAHIKLQNTYLQHLSGINSTCSFNSARTALINASLISYQKQFYKLETFQKDSRNSLETFQKDSRNSLETFQKDSRNSLEIVSKDFRNSLESSFSTTTMSIINKEIEIEKEAEVETRAREDTTATATAVTFSDNNMNSSEVQEMWFRCEGEAIPGGVAFGLLELEKKYGVEPLCKAILTASQANTQPRLSYPFVKAVLERTLKGGEKNAGNSKAEDWELARPAWLDGN